MAYSPEHYVVTEIPGYAQDMIKMNDITIFAAAEMLRNYKFNSTEELGIHIAIATSKRNIRRIKSEFAIEGYQLKEQRLEVLHGMLENGEGSKEKIQNAINLLGKDLYELIA
ncbi:MAG TPA: hypothetical protein VMR41_06170 [Patescibacteria group bacterium]|nr:hypothetical protein [Patescibacteria group bacterium]